MRASSRPALSIVMPAYNEAGNVERAVRHAMAAASGLVASHEVVVVDDGSRDATAEILERLSAECGDRLQVLRHPTNQGYGAALRDGLGAARGELIFYTDADNQFDLGELGGFLPLMRDHDVAVGFRIARQDSAWRRFSSGVFNALASALLGLRVRDVNCSFKLFRREVVERLTIMSDDFLVDAEMVGRVRRAGWRLCERGVRHYPRTAGRSTVRGRDVPRTIASLLRLWSRLRGERTTGGSAQAA